MIIFVYIFLYFFWSSWQLGYCPWEEIGPMAASSPASNNSKAVDSITAAITNGTATPQRSITLDPPKQNLRGLNKPKCIKCGNVARSRYICLASLVIFIEKIQYQC